MQDVPRSEEIDGEYDNQTDRDPGGIVHFGRLDPVVDENGRGGQFSGQDNSPVVPATIRNGRASWSVKNRCDQARWSIGVLVPSESKSESGVNKTIGELQIEQVS
jgi:hypothetical protein